MKVLGNWPMAMVLRVVVEIGWWVHVIGLLIAVVSMFGTFFGYGGPVATPVGFELDPTIYEVDAGFLGGAAGVEAVTGYLRIGDPALGLDLGFQAWALFGLVIGLVMWYHVRAIVRSFTAGDVFAGDNVRRIRIVAIILVGWGLLQPVALMAWNIFLSSTVVTSGIAVTPGPDTLGGLVRMVDGGLFPGLVLLVLAEVFGRGSDLREDQRLTV